MQGTNVEMKNEQKKNVLRLDLTLPLKRQGLEKPDEVLGWSRPKLEKWLQPAKIPFTIFKSEVLKY